MSDRTTGILDAAYACFTRHGARRTTMNDLAEQAGLSRPALYQYFRNKEDVFRSLVEHLLAGALAASEAAAAAGGTTPQDKLAGILQAKLALVMRIWRDSPAHAAELLGVEARLAPEALAAYDHAMLKLLTGTLQDACPGTDAREAAQLLLAFTRGLEAGVDDPGALPDRLRRGVAIFTAGLSASTPSAHPLPKDQP